MICRFDNLRRYPTVFLKMTGLRLNEFADLLDDMLPRFAVKGRSFIIPPRLSFSSWSLLAGTCVLIIALRTHNRAVRTHAPVGYKVMEQTPGSTQALLRMTTM